MRFNDETAHFPIIASQYSKYRMDSTASAHSTLKFFWTCLSSALFSQLSSHTRITVAQYLRPHLIPYCTPTTVLIDIQSNCVRVFDLISEKSSFTPYTETRRIASYASTWVVLSWAGSEVYSVFCCGGAGYRTEEDFGWWDSAYLIEIGGKISTQPNMQKARGNHGLVEWKSHIYAFGGCKP